MSLLRPGTAAAVERALTPQTADPHNDDLCAALLAAVAANAAVAHLSDSKQARRLWEVRTRRAKLSALEAGIALADVDDAITKGTT